MPTFSASEQLGLVLRVFYLISRTAFCDPGDKVVESVNKPGLRRDREAVPLRSAHPARIHVPRKEEASVWLASKHAHQHGAESNNQGGENYGVYWVSGSGEVVGVALPRDCARGP